MNNSPISTNNDAKIIRGSELVLIGFAALLLVAALQPEITAQEPALVEVNLPVPTTPAIVQDSAPEELPVKIHEITQPQTTALLEASHSAIPVAANTETPKLVN